MNVAPARCVLYGSESITKSNLPRRDAGFPHSNQSKAHPLMSCCQFHQCAPTRLPTKQPAALWVSVALHRGPRIAGPALAFVPHRSSREALGLVRPCSLSHLHLIVRSCTHLALASNAMRPLHRCCSSCLPRLPISHCRALCAVMCGSRFRASDSTAHNWGKSAPCLA